MKLQKEVIEKMNEYGKNGIPFVFIVDYDLNKPVVLTLPEAKKQHVYFEIPGMKNFNESKNKKIKKIIFSKYPVNYFGYKKKFEKVTSEIRHGNTYLLNLTFKTPLKTNLSLAEIFYISRAKYKILFKNDFVCFSPESFIKISGNTISTYPMKGTIRANSQDARSRILKDKKELAEQNTVVDLLRNDLSMVAQKVRLKKFRYIEKIKTNSGILLQISSEITGQLDKDWRGSLGDIIFKILPAGSICGAPKKKTVEIIKKIENYERGFYTGVFGFFYGRNLDSCVMIRFIEKSSGKMFYKSGGGITIFSNPKKEYKELIDKIYVPVV